MWYKNITQNFRMAGQQFQHMGMNLKHFRVILNPLATSVTVTKTILTALSK